MSTAILSKKKLHQLNKPPIFMFVSIIVKTTRQQQFHFPMVAIATPSNMHECLGCRLLASCIVYQMLSSKSQYHVAPPSYFDFCFIHTSMSTTAQLNNLYLFSYAVVVLIMTYFFWFVFRDFYSVVFPKFGYCNTATSNLCN